MIKQIKTKEAPAAIGSYSQAIKARGLVYTSGQIALKPDGTMVNGGIEDQTNQVLTNLYNILEVADSSFEDVVKTTIYLVNMSDFLKVNEIYANFFGENKPARSTIAVKELPLGALIEIECVALAHEHPNFG